MHLTWNENAWDQLRGFYSKVETNEISVSESALAIDLLKPQSILAEYIEALSEGMEEWRGQSLLSAFEVCGYLSALYLQSKGIDKHEMLDLLVSKQRDYGHKNITMTGIIGLSVRMCDKIARLNNLLVNRTSLAANEPIIDTWKDILGYAVISEMLLEGTFTTPLQEDVK